MAAFTISQKVPIKVEIYVLGGWVTVTSRGRGVSDVEITRSQSPGAIQPETDTMRCTLGNLDGWLTEDNGLSPWWPDIGRGCKIRLSLTGILGSDAQRFQGQIDMMVARYPGGTDSVMDITAIGTWGVLVQSAEPLAGAVARLILADTTDLVHYWHMYDAENTIGFAPVLASGKPMVFEVAAGIYEAPAWRTVTQPPGGGPDNAARLNESLTYTPDLTVAAPWSVSFAIRRPDDFVDGSPIAAVYFLLDGSQTIVSITGPTGVDATGEASWWHYYVTGTQVGADAVLSLWRNGEPRTGATYAGQTMGDLTRFSAASSACDDDYSMAEVAIYSNASVDYEAHSDALQAWVGERADVRIQRLCDEEGVDIEITGTSTVTMGPQSADTLPNLLEECALADQGLLGDGGTDGALTYVCNSSLYNAAAAVAVTRGALVPSTAPRWDRQDITNDVTSQLPDGSSYRVTDEDHVTRTNARIKRNPTVNLETAADLAFDAQWRLYLGTLPGPRYPRWGINLRNTDGAKLASTILAAVPGSRITVADTALPATHPAGGMDQLILGWTERLDADVWEWEPHTRPWAHDVDVYGPDADGGLWQTDVSSIDTPGGVSSTATSWSVATTGSLWGTTAAYPTGFPVLIKAGGLTYRCTAITGATSPQTFTVTRLGTGLDKSHAAGTRVTVAKAGRYAR